MAQHFSDYWRSGLRRALCGSHLADGDIFLYMQRVNVLPKKCLPASKEQCYGDKYTSYAHVHYVSVVSVLTNY